MWMLFETSVPPVIDTSEALSVCTGSLKFTVYVTVASVSDTTPSVLLAVMDVTEGFNVSTVSVLLETVARVFPARSRTLVLTVATRSVVLPSAAVAWNVAECPLLVRWILLAFRVPPVTVTSEAVSDCTASLKFTVNVTVASKSETTPSVLLVVIDVTVGFNVSTVRVLLKGTSVLPA